MQILKMQQYVGVVEGSKGLSYVQYLSTGFSCG